MADPDFSFIEDKPLTADKANYFEFYHATIAPALKKIIQHKTAPHTIGLFGSWGTGKSTIIEMVQHDPELKNVPVFIFDAWKYQEDTLRRTFLIKLVDFLKSQGVQLEDDILLPLYTSTSYSEVIENKPTIPLSKRGKLWNFVKKNYLIITTFALLLIYIAINVFLKASAAAHFLTEVLSILAAISFLSVLAKPLLEATLKQAIETLFKKQTQQTELITKVQYQERLNSPEQFEEKFKQILGIVNKKMIIVFDNIDRVQGDVAISMLSTIKTFMYSMSKDLVFVIPCDPDAIEVQISKYFRDSKAKNDSFNSSEYLRKIFNLILWVPEFINTDLEEYTKNCLASTGKLSSLLNNEDVILVINSAFSKNPREIIQFINNLVAMMIAAQDTPVSKIINANVAYMAKVLILRQRFPEAYNRLKENWYTPENVLSGKEDNKGLLNFMSKTNRITVEDAEPFIYFKDPIASRGLAHAEGLKNALVSNDKEAAITLARKERNKTKLAEFITDLIAKYSGQEQVLLNIISVQFAVIKELDIKVGNKNYFDNVARLIDTQLWGEYKKLPMNEVFIILSNPLLASSLRKALIERLVASLEQQDDSSYEMDKLVLDNFRQQSNLLGVQQLAKIRLAIENKYSENEDILNLFTSSEEQRKFITKELIEKYISSIDYTNIRTRMITLHKYRRFMINNELVPTLVSRMAERLNSDNGSNPDYNNNKAEVIDAIGPLVKTLRDELKHATEPMTQLGSALIQAYQGTSSWENWVKEIEAMWWLRNYVTAADRTNLDNNILNFFSKGPSEGWMQAVDHWNDLTTQRFITFVLPTIMPNLSTDEPLLQYMYKSADQSARASILSDLIQRVPVDNSYAINFIGKLKSIPQRKRIIGELLNKAEQQSVGSKASYYSYIAPRILKSDTDLKSDAIRQIKALIMSLDSAQGDIGLNFLSGLAFLTSTDRRELAKEILTWLREPGRIINGNYRVAFLTVTQTFGILQKTLQNDYVYFVFSLLELSKDMPTIQLLLDTLTQIRPSYSDYKKDFEDLFLRLKSWPIDQNKKLILEQLPKLANTKPRKDEKQFWDSFEKLDVSPS